MTDDRRARPLRRRYLHPDPLRQFQRWLAEAERAGCPLPEAAALATVGPDGRPSVRMVLIKGVDRRGFSFYTGYDSRKGRDLAANPRASLCFYWHELGRQVRVEGVVERVSDAESDAYFSTRPYGAQLSAAASRQSRVLADRAELEAAVAELRSRYPQGVPRPAHWGGYRLLPEDYEFWQHREDRLHDRFRYRRIDAGWRIDRLAP